MNPSSEKDVLLTGKELAAILGRSQSYVCAMKRSGFKLAIPGRYSLAAARRWLEERPEFRFASVYPHRRKTTQNFPKADALDTPASDAAKVSACWTATIPNS